MSHVLAFVGSLGCREAYGDFAGEDVSGEAACIRAVGYD